MPALLGTVILAAGSSRRMGRPKLLLPWGTTSVIGHLIRQWRDLDAKQIAIVCAAGDNGMQSELDRLQFPVGDRILNPDPERGMFSSVQCAANWPGWASGLDHFALVLGDQPQISFQTLRRFLDFAENHLQEICLPRQGGHRRHPILFPRKSFLELGKTKAPHVKDFLDRSSVPLALCALEDPALELDIDLPEEYERAMRLYLSMRDT